MESNSEESDVTIASRSNHLTLLRSLLQKGETVDVKDGRGWRPIHEAAIFSGGTECLEELVKHEATDVNWKTDEGETALLLACKRREGRDLEKAVDILLGYGANPNISDSERETPLLVVVKKGNMPVIKRLLNGKCNSNFPDCSGWYPLHQAAMMGHLGVVNVLLDEGAQVTVQDECGLTPVFNASQHGHAECLEVLLKAAKERGQSGVVNRGDKHWDCSTPLIIAAEQGHADCIRILLEHGANPYLKMADSTTALHKAIRRNHADCLMLLLKKMNLTPFIKSCHPSLAVVHIDPPIHMEFISPIHIAIEWESYSCLEILLKSGFSPNSIYRRVRCHNYLSTDITQNHTALSYAIRKGDEKSLNILRDAGASCEYTVPPNLTPMLCALLKPCPKMLRWLLNQGVGVNPAPVNMNRVFLTAMKFSSHVKEILFHGCDPQPCFQNPVFCQQFTRAIMAYSDISQRLQLLEWILCFLVVTTHVQKAFIAFENDMEILRERTEPLWCSIVEQSSKPSLLKHMCRMNIRRRLYSIHGVRLVKFIKCLSLPDIIHNYLSFTDLHNC